MPFTVDFEPTDVPLLHRELGQCVGHLRPATLQDFDTWEARWHPLLEPRYDALWPWKDHILRAMMTDGWLALSIAVNGSLEGMISLGLQEARRTRGGRVVYVEYVGSAPWNDAEMVKTPLIRGVGRALMMAALTVALDLDVDGVGLHAKPKPLLEAWYRNRGFRGVGREDGEMYFEITAEEVRLQLEGTS